MALPAGTSLARTVPNLIALPASLETQMKRIAYLLADFPVLSETFVGNEIRAMEALGHTVLPVIMNRRTDAAQPEDVALANRSTLMSMLPRGAELLFWPGLNRLLRAGRFTRAQKMLPAMSLFYQGARIARFLRREKIDHVHAHFAGGAAAHAIVAARLAGATVSFVCHGHDVYSEPQDLPAKLSHADFVVSVCRDLTDDLKAIEPQARIVEVPCGTNAARFTPRETGDHNGRLLFIGRLVEQKGLDDLLAALAALPVSERPHLDIVGNGPMRDKLKDIALNCGLRFDDVSFLGPRAAAWFAEHGATYRGLVAPFKCGPDGARDTGPLVVKEAMAMGLPVISTAYMGVKETVTPETGWLSAPADPSGLVASIRALLVQDAPARKRMGIAARERVEAMFTLERSARLLSAAMKAAS